MISIELEDVQGLIIKGYGRMHNCRYLLMHITESSLAKAWLNEIVKEITTAKDFVSTNCLNIAFTSQGLKQLDLAEDNLDNFSLEFREGMDMPHRNRILGDVADSDPASWTWGSAKGEEIHVMLLIFGATLDLVNRYHESLRKQFANAGLREFMSMDGQTLPESKEHLG